MSFLNISVKSFFNLDDMVPDDVFIFNSFILFGLNIESLLNCLELQIKLILHDVIKLFNNLINVIEFINDTYQIPIICVLSLLVKIINFDQLRIRCLMNIIVSIITCTTNWIRIFLLLICFQSKHEFNRFRLRV